ncbi:hypothetical protein A5881_004004 [Enterococcus termitis]
MDNYTDALKFLRTENNLKQKEMIIGSQNDNSLYSRLETGKLKIKIEHIEQICDHLDLAPSEFMAFAKIDTDFLEYKDRLNKAINRHTDVLVKEMVLKDYYRLKNINPDQVSMKELAFLYTYKNNLHKLWYEVDKITPEDTNFIVKKLSEKNFFTMYDYILALNTINYMDRKQADTIVKLMIPIKYKEQRTMQTKKYANVLITNIISFEIYQMEYEQALEYIELAEKQDPTFQSYYFRFDIQYHKNLALYFLKKDTKYIDTARKLISSIEEIQDIETAKIYKIQLNHLVDNPAYYKKNTNYDIVQIKEQN